MTAVPAAPLLPATPVPSRETGWWAMVCVCATEASLFAVLITAYFYLAMRSATWPPAGIQSPELEIPMAMTVALLSSSGAMAWAEHGVARNRRWQLIAGLATAIVLGVIFLGLFVHEYHDKLRLVLPQTHAYASLFYVITGIHGAHVSFGLLLLGFTLLAALRGHFDAHHRSGVAIVALYWHFVDLVWLVIVATLYLSPRLM
ncbi:MAG: cytochrome c oxidase subunit 3 [Gemmatimonadales bacterium]